MSKVSLNELMGRDGETSKGKELTLDDLHQLLGERMPKLEFHPVGRLRLLSALRNRFGDNWKHLPGLDNIVKEFDKEADFNVHLQKIKMIKAEKKNG